MNNGVPTPAQEALLRVIAEKAKTDPFAGAKLGGKEVFSRLVQTMKTDKGVQVESLLCALGALAGYACQLSVRANGGTLHTADCADGRRYYFGDLLNKPLAEDRYSVWSMAAAAAQASGGKTLPDMAEIFQHASTTVGSTEFGIPRTMGGHKPGDLPINYLKTLWPALAPQVKLYCPNPSQWPILFAIAIQQAIKAGRNSIEPSTALRLVMECAVSMSKVELVPAAQPHAQTTSPRTPPPIPTPDAPVRFKRSTVPQTRPPWVEEEPEDDPAQSRWKLWRLLPAIFVVSLLLPKTRYVALAALALLLSVLYYLVFVFSFVPSKPWSEVSIFVGLIAALLVTIFLMMRGPRERMLAEHSFIRVMIAIVAAFGMSWWLAYLANNYIVGDIVTRLTGQPVSMSKQVTNTNQRKRWRCAPRLIGRDVGRGKCISRELHRQLPKTVNVTVRARQSWAGYAISDIIVDPAQQQDHVAW